MYNFDVSYPRHLDDGILFEKQKQILSKFPGCKNIDCKQIHNPRYSTTLYTARHATDIARVASALKNADPRLFISFVQQNGENIYLHPDFLNNEDHQHYINILKHLHAPERVLHDYLVNLYHGIPT